MVDGAGGFLTAFKAAMSVGKGDSGDEAGPKGWHQGDGSAYDLDPNSPHNMSNEESADWMAELERRQAAGQPLDKPPGFYPEEGGQGQEEPRSSWSHPGNKGGGLSSWGR